MIAIQLKEPELNVIYKIMDAALKGSGMAVSNECEWLKSKVKAAIEAEKKLTENEKP